MEKANKDGADVQIELVSGAPKSGYWNVPNSYYKRVRKMSMNELRDEIMKLAAAVVDHHNANYILAEREKKIAAELKALKGTMEGQND
jgi:hypothetical protein